MLRRKPPAAAPELPTFEPSPSPELREFSHPVYGRGGNEVPRTLGEKLGSGWQKAIEAISGQELSQEPFKPTYPEIQEFEPSPGSGPEGVRLPMPPVAAPLPIKPQVDIPMAAFRQSASPQDVMAAGGPGLAPPSSAPPGGPESGVLSKLMIQKLLQQMPTDPTGHVIPGFERGN